ncbi:MAG: hypothetical protein EOP04_26205 [Proteobacteria bacterium]|nr:MAG: hypothetical protein EOP04_26205 [Pseudomonadota bacterium]
MPIEISESEDLLIERDLDDNHGFQFVFTAKNKMTEWTGARLSLFQAAHPDLNRWSANVQIRQMDGIVREYSINIPLKFGFPKFVRAAGSSFFAQTLRSNPYNLGDDLVRNQLQAMSDEWKNTSQFPWAVWFHQNDLPQFRVVTKVNVYGYRNHDDLKGSKEGYGFSDASMVTQATNVVMSTQGQITPEAFQLGWKRIVVQPGESFRIAYLLGYGSGSQFYWHAHRRNEDGCASIYDSYTAFCSITAVRAEGKTQVAMIVTPPETNGEEFATLLSGRSVSARSESFGDERLTSVNWRLDIGTQRGAITDSEWHSPYPSYKYQPHSIFADARTQVDENDY